MGSLIRLAFILGLFVLSGCNVLNHLDELSVLGQYARESDDQQRLIRSNNEHYDKLVGVIKQGHIDAYKNEASFVYSFGRPILKKDLANGVQRWLYRYAIYKTAKDKVYVYFDRNGKMIKWERLPCPKLF
ncbi:MAG: hypothetical protein KGI24_01650 [Candidatus Omnitrophica bacterium]|nr:hypothetical protein [Candidatus Omnitrophota bacterium]MDE2231760.1 hypothetical protein [Candidatus Omnitrophota bacterium]